jgi:hypothetical protein
MEYTKQEKRFLLAIFIPICLIILALFLKGGLTGLLIGTLSILIAFLLTGIIFFILYI